jgi:glyoxylate reductase
MKPKVFVTRRIPDAGMKMIQKEADIDLWEAPAPPEYSSLVHRAKGVDGLLCMLTDKIDANLMDAIGPQLKVISQVSVGIDNIDLGAATDRGIPVGNTPGVLTDTTADLAWALLMAAARRIVESDRFVREGRWKTWGPIDFLGLDIAGSTLGIIGFGRIGQAVARRAAGFGMRVLYYSRTRRPEAEEECRAQYVDLETLLRESDFVSLHTNLTAETHHFINEERLSMMKPTGILINTARGSVVDPKALHRALTRGVIAYAALDVTEPEPIDPDDPLLKLANIVVIPHIGSASVKTRSRMAEMAAENLIAGLTGKLPPNCANPHVVIRKF